MKSTNWLLMALATALIAAVFFAFAKPGSKLDFLGWFKAEQGIETAPTSTTKLQQTDKRHTVIGTIRINNRSARQEQIRYVSIKGETASPRVSLDGNAFRLREVRIPDDRLITIAIELVSGESVSELLPVSEPNANGVIDLHELLLDINYPLTANKTSRRGSSGRGPVRPTITIINQNVQKVR